MGDVGAGEAGTIWLSGKLLLTSVDFPVGIAGTKFPIPPLLQNVCSHIGLR